VRFRWRKWESGNDDFGQGGGVYAESVTCLWGDEALERGHDGGGAGEQLGGFAAVAAALTHQRVAAELAVLTFIYSSPFSA